MRYFIITIFLFSSLFVHSQASIKSRIITAERKESLGFVHILNKNTHVNALSDSDGWFNIPCKNSDTIVVRCMGFKTLSLLAAEANLKKTIELAQDTVLLTEVSVSPINAYRMFLQARDSTNKYQMKYFHGTCFRQDSLLFKGNVERKSEAEIIFKQKGIKRGFAEVNYWLKDLNSKSLGKQSDQPRLAYPNTIPLNSIKIPTEKAKYTIVSNSDSMLIINVKMAKPSKNKVNEGNYFINKDTWIIKGIEYKGDFRMKPEKEWEYHFFQTNVKLTYNMDGDSCVLRNFYYKMIFSHKKVDPKSLWEYFVYMDIVPTKNTPSMTDNNKLRPLDFLLYKNKEQKSESKHK